MIKIITDSTCDIPRERWAELGITVIPLTINFNGRIYKDGYDLGHREFYEKLEKTHKLPTTSQVNPGEFEVAFENELGEGDEIIGIFLSSELSGTFQSAHIAANAVCPERIFVVDSRVASFGLALLVLEAVKMRDSGKYTAAEMAKTLQKLALRIRLVGVVDTLKYLKMGGRLSSGAAAVGSALGITPLLQVYDGSVSVIGKVRGEKGGLKALQNYMTKHVPDFRYPIAYGHSNAQERLERTVKYLKTYTGNTPIYTSWIGSVIGTHTGPGVIAVAYVEKE